MLDNTLVFPIIFPEKKILLGKKKRGFGAGHWNGFGGKLLPHESVEEAAKRELQEESGLAIRKPLCKCALLEFAFLAKEIPDVLAHVFLLPYPPARDSMKDAHTENQNEDEDEDEFHIRESEEMLPQWFSFAAIPYTNMWEDDILWLPHVIAGKWISGNFKFDHDNRLLNYDLQIS